MRVSRAILCLLLITRVSWAQDSNIDSQAIAATINTRIKIPAAIATSNPPGVWNNNGKGGINQFCIPFGELLGGAPALSSPDQYQNVLGVVLGSGVLQLLEPPVNFFVASTIVFALWNAYAPYHPTMLPGWYDPGVARRPAAERTVENINIATMYAVLRVCEGTLNKQMFTEQMNQLFTAYGLSMTDTSTDPTTAIGIGNLVAQLAIKKHNEELWNAQGNLANAAFPTPYSDIVNGFIPMNTAYQLSYISKWQPLLEHNGRGYYTVQSFITPQAANMEPLLSDPAYFKRTTTKPPYPRVGLPNMARYRDQARQVLEVSAGLTDKQKMIAEYFDDKFTSFGALTIAIGKKLGWGTTENIFSELHLPCIVDASMLMWREKAKHNAVRPISAIRHLYSNQQISAWVQFKGKATINGTEWTSYLRTQPHPEYPSGTSCVCALYAEFMKKMTNSTAFPSGTTINIKAGCSRREPGITPAADVQLTYNTWDEFARECSQSRLIAGVHFQASIDEGMKACAPLGRQCYDRAFALLNGRTPN